MGVQPPRKLIGLEDNGVVGEIMVQLVERDDFDFAVGALTAPAAAVATFGKIDSSRLQGIRIRQWKCNMLYSAKTDGEGVIVIGFCHGLTAAEVSEAFTADPQGEDGIPGMERVKRPVFPVWVISKDGVESFRDDSSRMYNSIRYPWKEIPEGVSLQIFAHSPTDDITTGMIVHISSVMVAEWLRD